MLLIVITVGIGLIVIHIRWSIFRDYLDKTFPGKWIGWTRTMELSARLTDMTPLDFFLVELCQKYNLSQPVTEYRRVKPRIRNEMKNISPNNLIVSLQNFIQQTN